MKNEYTNNIDLYHTLNLEHTNYALFTDANHNTIIHLTNHNILDRADKIFLIGSEGNPHVLRKQYPRHPNLFVWDSVIDSTLDNYRLFLDHWDRVSLLDRQFSLADKLTNPLIESPGYKFDVLLGHQQPHREFIFDKILSSGIQNEFLVSYHRLNSWIPGTDETDYDTLAKLQERGHDFAQSGARNYDVPLVSPSGLTYNIAQPIPWKIFNNTWFSIIAETYYYKNFVTEKIGKALAANRIFINFGAVGMLAELKNLGFQTFDCVIDESYDSEPNETARWSMAWEQVEKLCKLDPTQTYTMCQSRLDHNRTLFSNIVQDHNYGAVINQVAEIIGGDRR